MLGETTKTSAAGKERGKVRSPFTNPFFPRHHSLQAVRFAELLEKFPGITTFMMNTGYVGGDALDVKEGRALKIKIPHSSAVLEALLSGRVKWVLDPDFGYYIVDVNAPENAWILDKVPPELLMPKLFFERTGRAEEYRQIVKKLKEDRRAYLVSWNVPQRIVDAL
jgi:phosphoenolpyruvate carboxykinase (ATP)